MISYKSKKDWWVTILVWGTVLFSVGAGCYAALFEASGLGELIVVLPLTVGVAFFFLWMFLTTSYVLDDNSLTVKYGPFRKVILLSAVKSAKKTRNPLSSPAFSLKRIEIVYNRYDFVLISPEDRDAFLKALAERCPNAKVEM